MAPDPEELLHDAEDLIEDWLCELDDRWQSTLEEAEAIRAAALEDAAQIVALARLEAEETVAAARREAGETVVAAGEELVALRQAVDHLRAELSRLVDAAFDALPAVEATSEAIDRALGEPEPDAGFSDPPEPPRKGLLRRLLRR